MVRVLQIVTVPLEYTGLPLFPLRLISKMPRDGIVCDFLVCGVNDERVAERIRGMGCALHIVPNRMRRPLRYALRTAKLIRENGYDAVHVHCSSRTAALDLMAARLGGARVRIAHSHNTQCKHALAHRLLRPLFDALYTEAFACGNDAGRWLFRDRPFAVLNNAIDVPSFAFDPSRRQSVREALLPKDAPVLGHVSGLSEQKNPRFLLAVLDRLRDTDWLLMVVGDGPLKDALAEEAASLGLSDRLILTGTRGDIPDLLQAMDAFLLPSLFEGLPTTALEAQAAGLPTLLSDVITRECDFGAATFLPPDPTLWAEAVRALPTADRARVSEQTRAALTEAGYDLTETALRMAQTYARLAEQKEKKL